MKKIKITHRFPDIEEVENKLKEITNSQFEFEIIKDETEAFCSADGILAIDAIIYFEKNWEEMLLHPGVYDIIKGSIILLWIKVYNRFKKAKSHKIDGNHQIEISFKKKKDGEIKFNLKGDLNNSQIKEITESLFEIASSEQKTTDLLSNSDYINPKSKKPIVLMQYNKEINEWEPLNYKEIHDYINKKINDANETYNS